MIDAHPYLNIQFHLTCPVADNNDEFIIRLEDNEQKQKKNFFFVMLINLNSMSYIFMNDEQKDKYFKLQLKAI